MSDEKKLRWTDGAWQQFEHGKMHWSSASGAHWTRGGIQNYWQSQNWENGWLGYPTSDEVPVAGGVRQTFQGGMVMWNPRTGIRSTRY